MSRTYSLMADLGRQASPFALPDANPLTSGRGVELTTLDDFLEAEVLVIVFMCNHCPYAQHVEGTLIDLTHAFQPRGVAFIAISSNDPVQYPEDSYESMATRAEERAYPFPYLFDETQDVAKSYGAVCTPDVFVFDRSRKLVYRGRFDETRPGLGVSTGSDLRHALNELLQEGTVSSAQHPAMGCNIKWKPGNEPLIAGTSTFPR